MKKFLAIVLAMLMGIPAALACEPAAALPMEQTYGVYGGRSGRSSWAVVASCRELAGIKSPSENVETLPVQDVQSEYLRGFAQGGMIRAAAAVRVIPLQDGQVAGLKTYANVTIRIVPEYIGTVAEIVDRRVGNEICAATIAAATLWRMGDLVSHIFFLQEADCFQVGTVAFNGGKESTGLWAGDFDGDGRLELGFKFGVPFPTVKKAEPEPDPTPEPEAKPEPKPTPKPQKCEPKPCESKPCEKQPAKVCFDFGIDLSIWFKGCVTFLKGCCGK